MLKNTIFSILSIFLLVVISGCQIDSSNGSKIDNSSEKIKVTTTIGMIADAVENIGGERVEVTGLMGPGIDPHLYKPSASDVDKLQNADIIFYGGLELEGRMTDIFVKIARSGKPTIAVSENIAPSSLREPPEFQGKYDPHIWFDVTLWKQAVTTISNAFIQLDPESQSAYKSRTTEYLQQLDTLHTYIQQQVSTLPEASRILVTAHDAFGYFGKQYGFDVHGLQGMSTATEASAYDVQKLADFVVQKKIKAIFIESSVPQSSVEAVQAAARSKGWEVAIGGQLYSDAMGNAGTPDGTYSGMVRHNIDTIVNSLQ